MFIDILSDFSDKNVEVTTSAGKTYSGELKHQVSDRVVVIIPTNEYTAKRFGPIFIKENEIISVREVLPYVEEDEDDCCDAKVPSPYIKAI